MDITGFALVTGGGSGIGNASCKALAKAGCRGILIADINLEGAKKTVSETQKIATSPIFRALAVHLDVTVEESVKHAIAYMVDSFGRMDYCIHCAGIPGGTFDELSGASFADFKHLLESAVPLEGVL
ncbi:putative short-chain dehydrogenase reductase family protein [Eutypa lata UCREL1]|uniref:Putative short-chain dehydrogenase reductase family protein n=1 Tax=Eutypa lata (strain UCR-EL1) TaxID=1287681 RepID=M7TKF4_EUTLA|nr:putative short-chain dehydrogenase reductase family protein [Eutypa lata UCREL1]